MKPPTTTTLLALLLLLSGAGLWLTWGLADSHTIFLAGGVAQARFCGDVGIFDCHQVANHESSWLFGIPLPYWGLVYYLVVAGLGVAAAVLRGPDQTAFLRAGVVVCGLAVLFDVYLAWAMSVLIGTVCVKCVATYAVNVLLLVNFWALGRSAPRPARWLRLVPSWRSLHRGADEDYYASLVKILIIGLTAVAVGLTWDKRMHDLNRILAAADEQADLLISRIRGDEPPEIDMAVFEGQPSLGPDGAPVQIGLLGDFRCHYCRTLARKIEELRLESPDRIRVWFVGIPSEHACNPHLPKENMAIRDACWLARGAECARDQDKFWEYHHYLYGEVLLKDVGAELVLERLPEIGLDPDLFRACVDGEAAKAAVEANVELGARIGLTTAPSIVINGHPKAGTVLPGALERIVKTLLQEPAAAP
jgi:protein-disulfide isomerase/uncharacterized membrane protein